jgi:peroxiredoxin
MDSQPIWLTLRSTLLAKICLYFAFTPTCSSIQVPGYLKNQDALKEAGIDAVVVYSVNDGAVMNAWANDQGIQGSNLIFFGDPTGNSRRHLV